MTCPKVFTGPVGSKLNAWVSKLKVVDKTSVQIHNDIPIRQPCGAPTIVTFTAVNEFELSSSCKSKFTIGMSLLKVYAKGIFGLVLTSHQ